MASGRRPIHGCVAAASATLGTLILALGVTQLIHPEHGRGIGYFFIGWGILMWFPVFARPAANAAKAAENWARFRSAGLICIGAALAANGVSALAARDVFRVRDAANFATNIGTLAPGLWLIGFVLVFFAAYYATQTKDADRSDDDD